MTPELVEVREYFQAPTPLYRYGSYRLEVGGKIKFGTGRWRTPNYDWDREYSWRATILWQLDQINRMTIEHPLPWMRFKPCTALVKEGPKAMVVYGGAR